MNSLNLHAAAAFLGIHPDTLAERAKAGIIPGAKAGFLWQFLEEDIRPFVGFDVSDAAVIVREIHGRERVVYDQFVYVLDESDDASPVKIGTCSGRKDYVAYRVQCLQGGNARRLRIVRIFAGCQRLEYLTHKAFKDERMVGEWFARSDRIRRLLACESKWLSVCVAAGLGKSNVPER